MKRTAVILVVVLLMALLLPSLGDAQALYCKQCWQDSYEQAICILVSGHGPEGFLDCYAYGYCDGDTCYEWCDLGQPCSWI